VTRTQKIERLESVLARVLARATNRIDEGGVSQAPLSFPSAPAVPTATVQPVTPAADVESEVEWPTRPPPPAPPEMTSRDRAVAASVVEDGARREALAGRADPPNEVAGDPSFDSRERLVAAPPADPPLMTAKASAEADADAPALAETSAVDVAPSDHPYLADESPSILESEPPPDMQIEEPPASSRRPVGPQPEEEIARIAFGADGAEPPRHTPPPESGRLPSPDESDLEPEAATLDPFDAQTDEHPVSAVSSASGRPVPSRLVVLETRAALPPDGDIAEMAIEVRGKEPETFVELLRVSCTL